ncbi:MAG: hypothetical protein RSE58_01265 [Clostridia bacterium]
MQQPLHENEEYQEKAQKRMLRRHGRFLRFMRGYLMIVGGLATLYVLVQLLVLLFVEIGKYVLV